MKGLVIDTSPLLFLRVMVCLLGYPKPYELTERSRLGGPRHAGPAGVPFSSARFARDRIRRECAEMMAPIVPDLAFSHFYKH